MNTTHGTQRGSPEALLDLEHIRAADTSLRGYDV